jgi:DNA-binding SARP family transcriptional activator
MNLKKKSPSGNCRQATGKETTDFPNNSPPSLQLLPSFSTRLEDGDIQGYIKKLSEQGVEWLFHFHIPLLAAHLSPLQFFPPSDALPLRIRLLTIAVGPGSDSSISDLEELYLTFTTEKDLEAASGCVGIAVQAIIDSGRDFQRFRIWLERARQLLTEGSLSPLARAFVLLHQGWAEIMGPGDIVRAYTLLKSLRGFAEQAESPSLILLHSALVSHIYYWRADLAALEILLTDVGPFLKTPQTSPFAALQYQAALGLLKTLQGEPKEGKKIYRNLLSHPVLEHIPPGTWLQIQGNYLYTVATLSDLEEVEKVGAAMLAKAVPEYNHYYHSYLHFNLGIVSLVLGRPHKALLHAQECRTYGELCASCNVARMSALVIGQALIELDRDDDALDHFRKWLPIWKEANYFIIAALGSIEMGYLSLRQGKINQARRALREAKKLVPKNERIPTLYRSRDYADRLEKILFPSGPVLYHAMHDTPISITTLGGFSVTMHGKKILYDRDWHGPKTKDLLKAIIALGGSKVPTERLAYLLWPDANGDQAMNAFKVTLSRLRNTLAGTNKALRQILVVKQKQISLSSSLCAVDALIFESLLQQAFTPVLQLDAIEAALELYGGNFLESSSDFWIINAREELCEQFVKATLTLCDYSLEHHDIQSTIPLLVRAMGFDPVNEAVYARLMHSYLLLGNRAKALAIYRKASVTLKREFGVGPGRLLDDLYQQMQRN